MPTNTVMTVSAPRAPLVPGLLPAGAYSLEQLEHLATVCHASGLFEDVTDVAQAFVKILKGQELGLPVMAAMGAFDIIRKRLFIKPWVIAAKINACGYGRYHVVTQTDEACTIRFARHTPGSGWQDCPSVSYTLAEARAQGLVERSPHWKSSPAHMLYQRCMGRGGAMYFPELLAGLETVLDATPLPPEQHAKNLTDLFDAAPDEPPTVAAPLPPLGDTDLPIGTGSRPRPERVEPVSGSPLGPGQPGASLIAQIDALLGRHQADVPAYWAQQTKRFQRPMPAAAGLGALAGLLQELKARHDQLMALPAADEGEQTEPEQDLLPGTEPGEEDRWNH